jgi:prepilin-type N-terminal cleavage/methylation domain-containing protein
LQQPLHSKNRKALAAFTLIELMVAMVILTIAMSIAFEAFQGTIRGWKRGTEVIDGLKHGEFSMNQLAGTLNSTVYFFNARKAYAFLFEKGSKSGLPADSISFVTSSGSFLPADSPLAKGPHRLRLFIDDEDGAPALYTMYMPAAADPEELEKEYEAEPLMVSSAIHGMEILFWDKEKEEWIDEWKEENAVPQRILLNLFIESDDEEEEPIVFSRVIEIPVYASMKDKLQSPTRKAPQNEQQLQSK